MGIDRTGPVGPLRLAEYQQRQQNRRSADASSREAPPREDGIQLSAAARQLAEADATEREELVRRIRVQVQAGAYQVDPQALARTMVHRGEA